MDKLNGLNELAVDLIDLEGGVKSLINKVSERLRILVASSDFDSQKSADYAGVSVNCIDSVLAGDICKVEEVLYSEVADAICWQVGSSLVNIIKPSVELSSDMKSRLHEKALANKYSGPIAYSGSVTCGEVEDGKVQEYEYIVSMKAYQMLKQIMNHLSLS